jgi:hypothetical protein
MKNEQGFFSQWQAFDDKAKYQKVNSSIDTMSGDHSIALHNTRASNRKKMKE